MSHWQQSPDAGTRSLNYRIYRTPVGKEVELIILSRNFVGARLHFWRGRTTPCAGEQCTACQDGQRPRWKGYLLAYHRATKSCIIFEFTDRGYDPLQAQLEKFGNLRGFTLRSRRLNKKPNGPIQIEVGDIREESPHLPKEVDLQEMLDRIWEIRQKDLPFEDLTA